MSSRVALFALVLTACGSRLAAQPPAASRQPASLQVYHVVIGQGAHYWEKYGHNMLWFFDPAAGIDVAYNWGTFDFDSPDFLERQLVGDPLYSVDTVSGQWVIQAYARTDRTVTLQRLNFTPVQAERALTFARRNMLPQHRFYRYDYYRDNCATRVRDVIDFAVGGALRRATATTRVKVTYRGETLRLLDDMPLTQFGTHVALGAPADRLLSVWETMFIPMRMRDALRLVRIPGADGGNVPLVAQERVVYESPRHRDRAAVPALWIPYLAIGILLGIEFLVVGTLGRRARFADVVFRVETAVFSLLTGLFGLVLLLAWTLTRHVFWFRNENLLLLNPLSLFLAALAVVAAAGKFIGFPQHNVALVCLFLPPHLAIAWSLWRRREPGAVRASSAEVVAAAENRT